MSADRTPEQIIGHDRMMQLVFEGYAVVRADHIAELEEGRYAARNLLTLFLCIDFDHFTEHDEALLDSVTEDSRRLLASPLASPKGGPDHG